MTVDEVLDGLLTEFAERYLRLSVTTRETSCIACGDPACRLEVAVAGVVDGHP